MDRNHRLTRKCQLDLVFTGKKEWMENEKVGVGLGCSNHHNAECRILRGVRKTVKLHPLHSRKKDFVLPRISLGDWQRWWKELVHLLVLLGLQEWSFPKCRKKKKKKKKIGKKHRKKLWVPNWDVAKRSSEDKEQQRWFLSIIYMVKWNTRESLIYSDQRGR